MLIRHSIIHQIDKKPDGNPAVLHVSDTELIDEDRPKAFYDFIRNKDYGLSSEIPACKRTLNKFRRFTGRAEGMSISFEHTCLAPRSSSTRRQAH